MDCKVAAFVTPTSRAARGLVRRHAGPQLALVGGEPGPVVAGAPGQLAGEDAGADQRLRRAQAERSPEVREHLATAQRRGRAGLGGSVPLALLNGLRLQWLVDPGQAPSVEDVEDELDRSRRR
ncbi:hypothetical protein GCM10010435_30530 [Winogradskya consettensis]|uniref:Uncharacterized protein n=1 Tax=Winogradskya consettensis TaxID=113560 RepID=A0A919VNX7_9ACTN|nr:hypothetical protein [Actinoplanes consettensis]GIM70572.1 hypothetical protein Aco04nite_20970 [Actinoplanes consettensis]